VGVGDSYGGIGQGVWPLWPLRYIEDLVYRIRSTWSEIKIGVY